MTTQNKTTKTIIDNDSRLVKVTHSTNNRRIVVCTEIKKDSDNQSKKSFFSFLAEQIIVTKIINCKEVEITIKVSEESPVCRFYTDIDSEEAAKLLVEHLEEITLDCLF